MQGLAACVGGILLVAATAGAMLSPPANVGQTSGSSSTTTRATLTWAASRLSGSKPRTEMDWKHRSIRAGRIDNWKWLDSDKGKGLLDLSRDPGETNDLSAQHPEVLAELQQGFAAWRNAMDDAEPRGPFRDCLPR